MSISVAASRILEFVLNSAVFPSRSGVMVKSAELVFYTGYNLMIVPVESLHSLQRAILAKEKEHDAIEYW